MKLTLAESIAIIDGLSKIKSNDAVVAFRIGMIIQQLRPILEVSLEARNKALLKYALKDSEGKPIIKENQYQIGDMKSFLDETDLLMNQEEDLNIKPIKLSMLKGCNVSIEDMTKIIRVVEDDVDEC